MQPWNLLARPTTSARDKAADPPKDDKAADPPKADPPKDDNGTGDAGFGTGAAGLHYGGPADDVRYTGEPDQAFGAGHKEEPVAAVPQTESEPAVLEDGSLVFPGGLVVTQLPPPDTSDDTADALPWIRLADDESDDEGAVAVTPEPDGS